MTVTMDTGTNFGIGSNQWLVMRFTSNNSKAGRTVFTFTAQNNGIVFYTYSPSSYCYVWQGGYWLSYGTHFDCTFKNGGAILTVKFY